MSPPLSPSLALLLGSYGPALALPEVAPAGALNGTARGMTPAEWSRTRHAEAVRALQRRGLSLPLAWWAAMALVGHWAYETGWGRAEWDYAVGNIRATGWSGPVHYLQGSDDAEPRPYRAYDTLADGIEDNIRLAVDNARYRPAFEGLLASQQGGPYLVRAEGREVYFPLDVAGWQGALTRAGWHPPSEASAATFRSTVTRVAQAVGAPPPEPVPAVVPIVVGGAVASLGALAAYLYYRAA